MFSAALCFCDATCPGWGSGRRRTRARVCKLRPRMYARKEGRGAAIGAIGRVPGWVKGRQPSQQGSVTTIATTTGPGGAPCTPGSFSQPTQCTDIAPNRPCWGWGPPRPAQDGPEVQRQSSVEPKSVHTLDCAAARNGGGRREWLARAGSATAVPGVNHIQTGIWVRFRAISGLVGLVCAGTD